MKAVQLAKAYNPKDFEDRIYSYWMKHKLFSPAEGEGEPFVIVIPPPNVTGVLHMGHGLNNSLQDILIRYYRMQGRPTLWIPGTDHAGIATQHVVERKLRARGTSRREIGREKFMEETWKVKDEHHEVITRQLKKIGASCDWSRERFTLDEGLSKAVREVFVALYERDLIYRGNYLINWCHSCGTALSDDEVEHKEVAGKLWHYYYPLADGEEKIAVATTRPETMLGDTCVAVHPEDSRYRHLVGRQVRLPLTDRLIPIIADEYVDMEFGSGAVKITPGHDPNDYEIAERHQLPKINILNPDGTLNNNVPQKYRGMEVEEARRAVVEDMKASGLFIKEEEHRHQIGHCYRCDTVIEPYMSEQWFVRMRSMADKALEAWRKQDIGFFPKKYENTYVNWLENIRDWCISRQLWWGHRIPVWYCDDCGHVSVSREDLEACTKCGSTNIRQDPDVLDTWFSSWLWPFSTLGWPEDTEDLRRFFPTSTLVTGYDIIFFWVARMIMSSLEFLEEVPFRDIVITSLVRDKQGRKMSKSLGNGMDPLDIVDQYGADSLKFTLAFLTAQGQDILLAEEDFRFGSKFANKIWNASRFLLMNLEGRTLVPRRSIEPREIDLWIYHRLNDTVERIERAIKNYRFNDAAQGVYEFFWNDFCDWYIEASKLDLYGLEDGEKDRAISLLVYLLEESLRLLHPFLPFVTEEIYQKLPEEIRYPHLITAPYPHVDDDRRSSTAARNFSSLQEVIRAVRTIRSEFTIPPEKKIRVHVRTDGDFFAADFVKESHGLIEALVNAGSLEIGTTIPDKSGAIPVAGNGFEVFVYVSELIDVDKERAKLQKELQSLEKTRRGTEKKLENPGFLHNAPPEVVEKERGKLKEFSERMEKIERYLTELDS
ncbi:MAG TPA: valine--tRNA ligase [Sediminispirochaeta sp.]|nr:valine--tRNA ligase [Sediminispirochaeta sp.]